MKNKNASDYQKKYRELYDDIFKLEADLRKKLLEMCIAHPDVPIAKTPDGTIIKAGGAANKSYFERIQFGTLVAFLQEIEKHIQANLPKQLEIPFNQ